MYETEEQEQQLEESEEQQQEGQQTEPETAPTPTTLAEAYAALRTNKPNNDSSDNQEGEAGESGESNGESDEGDGESDDGATGDEYVDYSGGYADDIQGIDSNAYNKAIIQQTRQLAAQAAAKEFKEKNYRKITVMDLRTQDDRGNVSYNDPDHPNRSFNSRYEAQQWVDSFNQQVDYDFKQVSSKYEKQYAEKVRPTIEMMNFISTYNKMDANTREMFDTIIEGNEIVANGQIVGYRCDLQAAAKQAQKAASRFVSGNTILRAAQAKKVSRPSTDMKSHGSSSGKVGDPEPKTIEEALKLYNKQKGNK